jgi:hypothetical protein
VFNKWQFGRRAWRARRDPTMRSANLENAVCCIEQLELRVLLSDTSGEVFVANYGSNTIGEYTTSGAAMHASLVSGVGDPFGIVVSGSDMLVLNYNTGKIGEYTTSGATVNASLISLGSGGQATSPGAGLAVAGSDLALSGSDLFVVDQMDTIGEYTTSGATVNSSLISGLSGPYGIAISGSDLFVTNTHGGGTGDGTIGEYTTSGATVNATLVTGLSEPAGIAVSGPDIFVVNDGSGSIGEYTTSGSTVNASLVSGLSEPVGIAMSGSDLFVANQESGTIGEYTTSGATVNASLISGLSEPGGICVEPSEAVAPATQLAFAVRPASITAGDAIPTIDVDVEDGKGNVVTTDDSQVTLSVAKGPSSAPNGTLTAQAVNGVATFSGISLSTAGTYTLMASDGALKTATSKPFVISPATAVNLIFVGVPTGTVTAGKSIKIKVEAEDTHGNLATNDTSEVTLGSTPDGFNPIMEKLVKGVATFNKVTFDTVGTYSFQASSGSLGPIASNSFVIVPAAARKLVFSPFPTITVNNPATIFVSVEDQFGNILTNDDATLATLGFQSAPKGVNLDEIFDADNGIVTFTGITVNTAGTYEFKASAKGLTTATSQKISVS